MWSRVVRLSLVTGCGVGGSIVNFLAQAIIAARFGAGQNVDAYVFSLGLPTFLAGLLATCVSYIVVPEIARVASDPERERALSGKLLVVVCTIAALLALTALPAVLIQPSLLLPAGSTIRDHPQLSLLIMLAWATGGLQLINALFISRLNAVGRQVIGATLSLPPGILSVIVLLTVPTNSIWIVAIGVLLGTLTVTLIGWSIQRTHFSWRSRASASGAAPTPIPRSAWLSVIALTCFSSYAVIDSFWAPRVGSGALASLGYAQRILIGAGNLVILGPSAIVVPMLARLAAQNDARGFRKIIAVIGLGVGGGGAVIATCIVFFASPLVSLLFKRGRFDSAAAAQVASALAHLAPGMAAMLIGVMVMRAVFCIPNSFRLAAGIGLGWSILYFLLSGLFVERGVVGIADAYSTAWITTSVVGSLMLWKRSASLGIVENSERSKC